MIAAFCVVGKLHLQQHLKRFSLSLITRSYFPLLKEEDMLRFSVLFIVSHVLFGREGDRGRGDEKISTLQLTLTLGNCDVHFYSRDFLF